MRTPRESELGPSGLFRQMVSGVRMDQSGASWVILIPRFNTGIIRRELRQILLSRIALDPLQHAADVKDHHEIA
jgi:hypothetical protein